MTKPYSADLRVRVVEAADEGATRHEAGERFGVSVSSAVRWHQLWRHEGTIGAKPYGGSCSPLEDNAEELLAVIEDQPDLRLDEIVAVMRKRQIPGSRTALFRFWRVTPSRQKSPSRCRTGADSPHWSRAWSHRLCWAYLAQPQSHATSAAINTSCLCSATKCVWLARSLLFRAPTTVKGARRPSTDPDGSATGPLVLMVLIEASGSVVSKDALMDRVWPNRIVDENRLQGQISALRRAFGAERDLIRTIAGRGYQFGGTIRTTQATASMPQLISMPSRPPTNLPEPVSPLIGRSAERDEILDLSTSHRLVTLTGPGGIGKTRLCYEVARRLLARFADGVWAAELALLSDPEFILPPSLPRSGSNPRRAQHRQNLWRTRSARSGSC